MDNLISNTVAILKSKSVDKLQGNEREEMVNERWAEKYPNGPGGNLSGDGRSATFSQAKRIVGNPLLTTKGTSEWEGWGTALKPAHEPICMARKPLAEKTVAENCLKYGTGGINIDESRVEGKPRTTHKDRNYTGNKSGEFLGEGLGGLEAEIPSARFPANFIHDNSEEVRECFPETKTGAVKNFTISTEDKGSIKFTKETYTKERPTNSGNASRFFKSIIYKAKASKSERNKGCEELEEGEVVRQGLVGEHNNPTHKNNHPTVKPIALMEYLIKMVTHKGGIVLDPFMGSGTTGCACKKNNFSFIGIEREEDYFKIAETRINNLLKQQSLF